MNQVMRTPATLTQGPVAWLTLTQPRDSSTMVSTAVMLASIHSR